jgi:hypothetical protein
MRILRAVGIILLVLGAMAVAKDNALGIHEVSQVKFDSAVHIGSTVLPAGEYQMRHSMEGQEHVMVFQRRGSKDEYKAKCTLVPLDKKAPRNQATYQTSGNEKQLQELVFQGDTAKHVFGN